MDIKPVMPAQPTLPPHRVEEQETARREQRRRSAPKSVPPAPDAEDDGLPHVDAYA
ncbi:MAG: hypothetical protein AB7I01_13140 [Gammaproteobacteria bacterium]